MPREKDQIGTLKFMAIAIVLMLIADQFLFGGTRPYIEKAKEDYRKEQAEIQNAPKPPPVRVQPPDGKAYFEAPMPTEALPQSMPKLGKPFPKIAIVIDDIGMDIKRSRAAIDLPVPVTYAVLPYAPQAKAMAAAAKSKGHSLIIHMPMEAGDSTLDIGPGGLKAGMDRAAFDAAMEAMFQSFEGYDGVNNHMGGRLTGDGEKMGWVMEALKARGLFFLDSKTNPQSAGFAEAQKLGVPFAARDVFLDHEASEDFTRKALAQAEARARKYGSAIAIGHPKDSTLMVLKAWIPEAKKQGFVLVPVKDLVK